MLIKYITGAIVRELKVALSQTFLFFIQVDCGVQVDLEQVRSLRRRIRKRKNNHEAMNFRFSNAIQGNTPASLPGPCLKLIPIQCC